MSIVLANLDNYILYIFDLFAFPFVNLLARGLYQKTWDKERKSLTQSERD